MKEVWKPIHSLDGLYEASNLGRIRSKNCSYHNKKEKILSLINNGNGYFYFTISINNKRKNVYVHRAVCEAFYGLNADMKYVNHKNGIKSDNNIDNLEWCNHSMNMKHAYENGLNRNRGKKPNATKVRDKVSGIVFDCIKDASEYYGIKYNLLKEALSRKCSQHRNEFYERLEKI